MREWPRLGPAFGTVHGHCNELAINSFLELFREYLPVPSITGEHLHLDIICFSLLSCNLVFYSRVQSLFETMVCQDLLLELRDKTD